MLKPGAMLGPYRIERPLGEGGMGDVYLGRDTRLGRDVAVKVVREEFGSRFQREARAISALNHPHICTLYDVGPDYLVMEYAAGQTLQERIRRKGLPLKEALGYAIQIADALAAAHAAGILHRDIKPANILWDRRRDEALLGDFGIAAYAEQAKGLAGTT
ncbi:MAG: serine/threonine protein kinase, partial [Acidobacteriota bacterium]|nr:serine/threonine protein kinase [Acidobacteriota bacterium]